MMKKIGIEDYDMRDLVRADSNRVRLILSAIINFAKFREEHLGILDELSGKAESLLESKRLVTRRNRAYWTRLRLCSMSWHSFL